MRECEIAEAEIVRRTLLLSFFFVALFLLFRKVEMGLGLALGCAGSIVNFKLLARNVRSLVPATVLPRTGTDRQGRNQQSGMECREGRALEGIETAARRNV